MTKKRSYKKITIVRLIHQDLLKLPYQQTTVIYNLLIWTWVIDFIIRYYFMNGREKSVNVLVIGLNITQYFMNDRECF